MWKFPAICGHPPLPTPFSQGISPCHPACVMLCLVEDGSVRRIIHSMSFHLPLLTEGERGATQTTHIHSYPHKHINTHTHTHHTHIYQHTHTTPPQQTSPALTHPQNTRVHPSVSAVVHCCSRVALWIWKMSMIHTWLMAGCVFVCVCVCVSVCVCVCINKEWIPPHDMALWCWVCEGWQ